MELQHNGKVNIAVGLSADSARWKNEYIERGALLPSITAGLVCAAGAAWLSSGISTEVLRRIFGIFLIFMGIIQLKNAGNVLE